eukprot:106056-Prymnesium_polylepis.1
MRKGARSIADLPRGSAEREAKRQLVFARLPAEWRRSIDFLAGKMTRARPPRAVSYTHLRAHETLMNL